MEMIQYFADCRVIGDWGGVEWGLGKVAVLRIQ
jgi:hypothetical protein